MFERINPPGWVGGWIGGGVGGAARKYSHFVVPSCKLRLARFSAELEIFQMGPSVAILFFQKCPGSRPDPKFPTFRK